MLCNYWYYVCEKKTVIDAQVHNDLKTKNILLSDDFEVAKIGAHTPCSCRLAVSEGQRASIGFGKARS